MTEPLLEVKGLKTWFQVGDQRAWAVGGVSFDVLPGEFLGIVGESGSGKSVTALSLMRLIPDPPGRIAEGEVRFAGRDLLQLPLEEVRRVRGKEIAMIFQEPMTSLNPVLTIGKQVMESLRLHEDLSDDEARARAVEVLSQVGIPDAEKRLSAYPHQFSGGMRQRVMIAMGLLCRPRILLADEPTTALDVTIQAQILELMQRLQHEHGTAIVLVTHDLGVVAGMSDRVNVMYAGRLVETAGAVELFDDPRHPYTLGLLGSVPRLSGDTDAALDSITGSPPDLADLPAGCAFRPRCDFATARCESAAPPLADLGGDRSSACVEQDALPRSFGGER